MDMKSTGVPRFIARCVSLCLAACLCAARLSAVCASGLTEQEKILRFKQLDSEAEKAMQQHRASDAMRLYEEAVCLVPNSARGYYGLGMAEAAAGAYLKARESLQTADRLQPTTGMPLLMQARVNVSLGDMEALKSDLRNAAVRFPHDAQLHGALARLLAEQNLFILALAEAMRSQDASDKSNSQLQLAIFENTVGALDDAVRNALALEQNHQLPAQIRGAAAGIAGLSYESLHQVEQAVRYLKEAIELDPSRENSYLALADLYDQQQKYTDAVNVLSQARTSMPNSDAVSVALAGDLVRADQPKEGLAILSEVIMRAPDIPEAYLSMADAARRTGDADLEVAALKKLKQVKPGYPMINVLLARAMLNQHPPPYTEILDVLSTAAKFSADDPEGFFLQGKVYIALGQYEKAVTALRRSIELRPTEPSPYYQLARVYQKLGQTDLANEQFRRVRYLESSSSSK